MQNDIYIINDLESFINTSRVLVFNSFGDTLKNNNELLNIENLASDDLKELDSVLSLKECIIISKDFIKKQINKSSNEARLIISEKKYLAMIESFNDRMVSNILNNLVNKGIVDSAYDSETNDFVFWVKDKNK